jgi:hypothetical protein
MNTFIVDGVSVGGAADVIGISCTELGHNGRGSRVGTVLHERQPGAWVRSNSRNSCFIAPKTPPVSAVE